ncbi:hypothetical protein FPQ18DRAFT_376703 [Pyronema domesticum]|nr:hypothetical protein FPQ18DRAFT_376703 [Pyronema domesticum]
MSETAYRTSCHSTVSESNLYTTSRSSSPLTSPRSAGGNSTRRSSVPITQSMVQVSSRSSPRPGTPASTSSFSDSIPRSYPLTDLTEHSEHALSPNSDSAYSSLPPPLPNSDDFLDTWDLRVFRCSYCNRPFITHDRLTAHLSDWHSSFSPPITAYYPPEADQKKNQASSIVVIAQGGDLLLQAPCISESSWGTHHHGAVQYQVASQILWVASPVFRRMFGPESIYKEASDLRRSQVFGNPTVVVLDDDSWALEVVLYALHHQNDLLPHRVEVEEMVMIAAICEKYELAQALRPVADRLFRGLRRETGKQGNENLLFVCQVFGYEEEFEEVSREMVMRATYEPGKGVRFGEAGNERGPRWVGKQIIEKILDVRKSHLEALRSYAKSLHTDPAHQLEIPLRSCLQGGVYKDNCEALQLGHLMKIVSKHNLDDEEMWNQSLYAISTQLLNIKNLYLPKNSACAEDHSGCSWVPGLHNAVQRVLESVKGLRLTNWPVRREGR